MADGGKYGQVTFEREPGEPFADEEPVFVLRAQDKLAPTAVRNYAMTVAANGGDGQHVDACYRVADRMQEWQNDHGSKMPD